MVWHSGPRFPTDECTDQETNRDTCPKNHFVPDLSCSIHIFTHPWLFVSVIVSIRTASNIIKRESCSPRSLAFLNRRCRSSGAVWRKSTLPSTWIDYAYRQDLEVQVENNLMIAHRWTSPASWRDWGLPYSLTDCWSSRVDREPQRMRAAGLPSILWEQKRTAAFLWCDFFSILRSIVLGSRASKLPLPRRRYRNGGSGAA